MSPTSSSARDTEVPTWMKKYISRKRKSLMRVLLTIIQKIIVFAKIWLGWAGCPLARVRRVGFFNFGSGRVRVLKKYFGSGRVGYRVFVSNTKSIGYYGVLKSWSGIRRVSPLFPILSNIYYLIWLIWSIKHVFGRHIYVIVVQCGRSWQPFGDRRKSHKPLESAHLQNFATKMPYL